MGREGKRDRVRPKMDRADRAKQFMPFDALKGFQEALREKERVRVSKRILSEEEREELNRELSRIGKMDMVEAEYFQDGEYVSVKGMVSGINQQEGWLRIVNMQIRFEDIARLTPLPIQTASAPASQF